MIASWWRGPQSRESKADLVATYILEDKTGENGTIADVDDTVSTC